VAAPRRGARRQRRIRLKPPSSGLAGSPARAPRTGPAADAGAVESSASACGARTGDRGGRSATEHAQPVAQFELSAGEALYFEYEPPGAKNLTFVFVHALTDNTGTWQHTEIGPALRAAGYGTLAWNFRGQAATRYGAHAAVRARPTPLRAARATHAAINPDPFAALASNVAVAAHPSRRLCAPINRCARANCTLSSWTRNRTRPQPVVQRRHTAIRTAEPNRWQGLLLQSLCVPVIHGGQ
jgi:hypothetical protein